MADPPDRHPGPGPRHPGDPSGWDQDPWDEGSWDRDRWNGEPVDADPIRGDLGDGEDALGVEAGAGWPAGLSEVCLLVGRVGGEDVVLWADRSGDPVALPDARDRWEALWRHRDHLVEVAHSHPGGGLAFSGVDEATMAAVDAALGRRLRYAVVTAERMLRRRPDGTTAVEDREPWWAALLRAASGLSPPRPAPSPPHHLDRPDEIIPSTQIPSHETDPNETHSNETEADRWRP